MSTAESGAERTPQSAAAPSPFPPIADYAFLSNCHTSALVAPDGSVDWLCVPRFDSPSVFGQLLDRQAGSFRLGPFGINVPTARIYEPGTNIVMTTWRTPTGWAMVRDALTMGPRAGEDTVTPHTRPPADFDGDHMLVRTMLCLDGSVEMELVCEPDFDYGRVPGDWSLVGDERHTADVVAGDLTLRLQTDMALGIEGNWVRARHALEQGEQAYCALSWAADLSVPLNRRRGERAHRGHHPLLAALAGRRSPPRPPLAGPDPALGARDQGPHIHADGRDRRGRHDLAARDARRRAQLGLPVHLDPRLDLHPAGAPFPQPGLGGRRVHAVRGRPRAERGWRPADHVRDRRAARPDRVHPRRAVRLRGRPSGPARQRSVRPASERRLRGGARLDPAAQPPQQPPAAAAVADRRVAGQDARPRSGASPTRASGRRAARRSTTSPRS